VLVKSIVNGAKDEEIRESLLFFSSEDLFPTLRSRLTSCSFFMVFFNELKSSDLIKLVTGHTSLLLPWKSNEDCLAILTVNHHGEILLNSLIKRQCDQIR
jgi:hypothetical protein